MELRKAAGDWLELEKRDVGDRLRQGDGTVVGRGGGGGGGSGKESATENVDVGLKTGGGGGGGEGEEGDQGYSPSGAKGCEKEEIDVLPNCFWEAVGDIGDGRLEVEDPDEGVM